MNKYNQYSYTYLIGWSSLRKYYYGVRFANTVTPKRDLWKKYKTSSKYVKEFVLLHGEPDIIQVRKKFYNSKKACAWEAKVLLRTKAIESDTWLNRAGGKKYKVKHQNSCKGKTYEEIYGVEKAAALKASRIASNKTRGKWSEESRKKLSETRKQRILSGEIVVQNCFPKRDQTGKNNPQYGKPAWNRGIPRDLATKEKIRQTLKSKPLLTCFNCGKQMNSVSNMKKYHNERCKW